MIKRIVCLIAIFAAVMGLTISINALTVGSGSCGKDGGSLRWSLSDNGVLTISGSGEMQDFGIENEAPWSESIVVTKVVVEEGITGIGECAFYGLGDMKTVSLPQTLEYIGDMAFYCCGSLEGVKIPDKVLSIGEKAFSLCPCITEIKIPDSVLSIGNSAFEGCNLLSLLTIGKNVETIGDDAFAICPLSESIVIPDETVSIGSGAFSFSENLKTVTIPDSVTFIGESALDFCGNQITVRGYGYSYAEEYTKINGIKFVSIGEVSQKMGDVNGDGKVDVNDLLPVINHISGRKLLKGTAVKRADAFADGSIDIRDYNKIYYHIYNNQPL